MFEKMHNTSQFEIVENTIQGLRYCFYCEVLETAVYTTRLVLGDSSEEELKIAWEEACPSFNGCSECGKWVRDEAYNIDEMMCIKCAPYKSKPRFCTECGCLIPTGNNYCVRRGHRLKEVLFDGIGEDSETLDNQVVL